MSLNLPDPNRNVGDPNHTQDTNLIIEGINTLKSQVDSIPAGPQGPQGEPGTPGVDGLAATISVASTVTTEPGANAQVTESGTPQNKSLTFFIPRGLQGPAGPAGSTGGIGPQGEQGPAGPGNTLSIGNVVTGAPASQAAATITGTSPNQALNLTIPQGPVGEKGDKGDKGDTGEQGPVGPPANLTNDPAVDLGVAASGTSTEAARSDHVHKMPSASDVGADPVGSAAAAESAAESYTDGVAAATLSAAEDYADSLAPNYDPVGSAAAAQAAAESYADGLGANYDPVGSAAAVAGDLSAHEGLTTDVHGITDTADLVYTTDSRLTDDRYPTAHAASHELNGDDEIEIDPTQVTGTALTESELSDDPASELSDTADAGTSGDVARADHVHNIMYDVPAGAVSFDTAPTGISATAGKVFWDEDFGTLAVTMSGPGAVTVPIGQKSGAEVKNKTGGTISKGKVVQFDGASGGNIEVAVAVNDGTVNPRLYFGVAAENIADDDEGFVVDTGYIRGLNTNAWAVGTLLYVGASGDLVSTPPAKPAFQVPVAAVTFQNSSAGVIYVRMDNGLELNELFDVDIDTPTAGQVLAYDDVDGIWKNQIAAAPVDDPFPVGMFLGGM
jgi:hypothetical protein